MNIQFVTEILKAKQTGRDTWKACCPSHADRTPSLTIKDLGDGRILLNCFAGCSVEDVMGAAGLTWDDIMPERAVSDWKKPERVRVYATDALKLIKTEMRIVAIAAFDMAKGNTLADEDRDRLMLAVSRINEACEMANV